MESPNHNHCNSIVYVDYVISHKNGVPLDFNNIFFSVNYSSNNQCSLKNLCNVCTPHTVSG